MALSENDVHKSWSSPQPGKVMDVPQGARGEVVFRCANDTDSPVVYEPKVEGLPQIGRAHV